MKRRPRKYTMYNSSLKSTVSMCAEKSEGMSPLLLEERNLESEGRHRDSDTKPTENSSGRHWSSLRGRYSGLCLETKSRRPCRVKSASPLDFAESGPERARSDPRAICVRLCNLEKQFQSLIRSLKRVSTVHQKHANSGEGRLGFPGFAFPIPGVSRSPTPP